jgi:hypothetical protein
MRWAKLFSSVISLVSLLLVPVAAHAVPVGEFSWNEYSQDDCDLLLLCGPFFSVGNGSNNPEASLGPLGAAFVDVFVDLETGGGLQSFSLGEIAPGDSRQTIEDLLGVQILSAGLRLTFGVPELPGLIRLVDQDRNPVTALTTAGLLSIDYTAPEEPVSVPEPSTLLLLGSGFAGIALWRKTRT